MTFIARSFDWNAVQRWAREHLNQAPPDERRQIDEIRQVAQFPQAWVDVPAQQPRPVALEVHDWLDLNHDEMLAQVRLALTASAPTQSHLDSARTFLPGFALAACRQQHFILAAELLRLMLHWNIETFATDEVAEFLAFQQRPDGSCGYFNPFLALPCAREHLALQFHLPITHAICMALAQYNVQTSRTEVKLYDPA